MAITAGSDILASDFIDTSAGAGDSGKGVKLNARGLLSQTISKRDTTSTASSATPSINVDDYERLVLTAQALDITSMSSGLSGTPYDGKKLNIQISPTARGSGMSYINRTNANTGSASSITGNKPTNTADGDIIFAILITDTGESTAVTAPAGWTTHFYKFRISGLNKWVSLYWKIASSEGASWNWSFSPNDAAELGIVTYRGGFNPTNPIESPYSKTTYVTNDTNLRAASFNVKKPNSPLIFFGLNTQGNSTKPTLPTTGWVEDTDTTISTYYMTVCSMMWASSGDTGVIDATISGASTSKLAFAIALNPELDVTWGSSYNEAGEPLPTKIWGTNPISIDFVYSTGNSKWNTKRDDRLLKRFNSGVSSVNMGTIGDDGIIQIAHGLARPPKKVRILAVYVDATIECKSDGYYTENGNSCLAYGSIDAGAGKGQVTSSSVGMIISSDPTSDFSTRVSGVITVGDTNIEITCQVDGSPTGTASILWEAAI